MDFPKGLSATSPSASFAHGHVVSDSLQSVLEAKAIQNDQFLEQLSNLIASRLKPHIEEYSQRIEKTVCSMNAFVARAEIMLSRLQPSFSLTPSVNSAPTPYTQKPEESGAKLLPPSIDASISLNLGFLRKQSKQRKYRNGDKNIYSVSDWLDEQILASQGLRFQAGSRNSSTPRESEELSGSLSSFYRSIGRKKMLSREIHHSREIQKAGNNNVSASAHLDNSSNKGPISSVKEEEGKPSGSRTTSRDLALAQNADQLQHEQERDWPDAGSEVVKQQSSVASLHEQHFSFAPIHDNSAESQGCLIPGTVPSVMRPAQPILEQQQFEPVTPTTPPPPLSLSIPRVPRSKSQPPEDRVVGLSVARRAHSAGSQGQPPPESAEEQGKRLGRQGTVAKGLNTEDLRAVYHSEILANDKPTEFDAIAESGVIFPKVSSAICICICILTAAHSIAVLALRLNTSVIFLGHGLRDWMTLLFGISCAFAVYSLTTSFGPETALMSLESHACASDFQDEWTKASKSVRKRLGHAWLILLCTFIAAECLSVVDAVKTWKPRAATELYLVCISEVLSLLSFVFSSGLLVVLVYLHSNQLTGLDKMLDNWCSEMFERPNFRLGVRSWNKTQAILRRTGKKIDGGFFVVQTCAFIGLGILGLSFLQVIGTQPIKVDLMLVVEMLFSLPCCVFAILTARLAFQAAGVTQKCSVMPSMINQIVPEGFDEISYHRSYLVDFITHSGAGFYMKGVRLTHNICVRLAYTFGAVVFGLVGLALRLVA